MKALLFIGPFCLVVFYLAFLAGWYFFCERLNMVEKEREE